MQVHEMKVGETIVAGLHRITRLPNKNGKVRMGVEGPDGSRFVADVGGEAVDLGEPDPATIPILQTELAEKSAA